jgi:hypothetical protein
MKAANKDIEIMSGKKVQKTGQQKNVLFTCLEEDLTLICHLIHYLGMLPSLLMKCAYDLGSLR